MHARSSAPARGANLDPLSEILRDLRLTDGSYGRCELTHPWGISFERCPQARFHFVASGECALRGPKGDWTELRAGDVVLVPEGKGHWLASREEGRTKPLASMPLEPIGERTYNMRAGGKGRTTILVCCSVTFGQPGAAALLALMPPVLLVRGGGQADPTLSVLLDAMAEEVTRNRVGAATVMTRLADVVIARVVRAWVENECICAQTGWLAAIRDPQMGRALVAIHQRPGEAWSVESLAREAGTSRTVFAERFAAVVGMPPARYLAQWRMQVAHSWLNEARVTVAEAALRLGYDSEAAFSRAFKRFNGMPPSEARRRAREQRLASDV